MSRPSFTSIGPSIGLVFLLTLSSCVDPYKVHYPKLKWKDGGPSQTAYWNRALGTAVDWETSVAKVSTSKDGSLSGPRCGLAEGSDTEKILSKISNHRVSRKLDFLAELRKFQKFQGCFAFRKGKRFPEICRNADIQSFYVHSGAEIGSLLNQLTFYYCENSVKKFIVVSHQLYFPDTR